MNERNPIYRLYYVSNGNFVNDSYLATIIEENKIELDKSNLFEKVELELCDSRKLYYLYIQTKKLTLIEIAKKKAIG